MRRVSGFTTVRYCIFTLPLTVDPVGAWMVEYGLTSHSTHYRSFRGRRTRGHTDDVKLIGGDADGDTAGNCTHRCMEYGSKVL